MLEKSCIGSLKQKKFKIAGTVPLFMIKLSPSVSADHAVERNGYRDNASLWSAFFVYSLYSLHMIVVYKTFWFHEPCCNKDLWSRGYIGLLRSRNPRASNETPAHFFISLRTSWSKIFRFLFSFVPFAVGRGGGGVPTNEHHGGSSWPQKLGDDWKLKTAITRQQLSFDGRMTQNGGCHVEFGRFSFSTFQIV